jgi:hypothetical protein
MDVRRYDPRRIVRDALDDHSVASDLAPTPTPAQTTGFAASAPVPDAATAQSASLQAATEQRWIVAGGTSGHPRRILAADPRSDDRLTEQPDARSSEPRPAGSRGGQCDARFAPEVAVAAGSEQETAS